LALDLAAIEEKACARRLEELCEMQDRAIQALKNALEATQLALNTIERNRAEQGYKQQFQWQQAYPQQPYIMYPSQIIQYPEGFWHDNGVKGATGATLQTGHLSALNKYEYNLMSKLGASVKDLLNAKDDGNVNEVNSGNQAASGAL